MNSYKEPTHSRESVISEFRSLFDLVQSSERTQFQDYLLIITLSTFHLRFEKEIAFNKTLDRHPYDASISLINEMKDFSSNLLKASFASNVELKGKYKGQGLIEKHQQLWQEIWTRHNIDEFKNFVKVKRERFEINNLTQFVKDRNCVEFGCGNGAILAALIDMGAKFCSGIDFGQENVQFAKQALNDLGYSDKVTVEEGNVLDTQFEDSSFDFAVSNGVFHHLEKTTVPKALSEVYRVLKPGGYFWYYMDGNSLTGELWDISVEKLQDIDPLFMESIFELMGLTREKTVHLMDSLNATYIHNSYESLCQELKDAGFVDFQRMLGGTEFDMDSHQEIDPYTKAKFGDGDLRVLARKPE